VLVGLIGVFDCDELEDTDEESDFLDAAESDACSLMEFSCELPPESFGDGEAARVRRVVVNDRIGVYRRLGRGLEGHSLAGGSLKGFIIFRTSS
jgi:hypothetical protein